MIPVTDVEEVAISGRRSKAARIVTVEVSCENCHAGKLNLIGAMNAIADTCHGTRKTQTHGCLFFCTFSKMTTVTKMANPTCLILVAVSTVEARTRNEAPKVTTLAKMACPGCLILITAKTFNEGSSKSDDRYED